jgi:hypothetical protein
LSISRVIATAAAVGVIVATSVVPSAAVAATSGPVVPVCPTATVSVSTADALKSALTRATPGTVIRLADGTYRGQFRATVAGTALKPIFLCGSSKAILDNGTSSSGVVLALDRAHYWRVLGLTVRNGQKGVMVDRTVGAVLGGLTVTRIGHEGIHLRRFSTDNLVVGNTVSYVGRTVASYGEGVYVGSAQSNWCNLTACVPDRSDRNVIANNTIHHTTAEAVDLKEGTSSGTVSGNSFNGYGMTAADSWVDAKGNDWLISGNIGVNASRDGFQTHRILTGWGTRNRFVGNTATVNGSGYGVALTPVAANLVTCDNVVKNAPKGLANVACQP